MIVLWREPRPTGAPPVGRRDWLLVGAFEVAALAEGLARPGLPGQPLVTLLAMALMPLLLWRRSHPLATCLIGFGAAGLLAGVQLSTRDESLGLTSMMVVLLLLYALVRWGSGREIARGLAAALGVVALGLYAAASSPAEAVGAVVYVLLFVAVAAVVRSRADLWQRRQREIRNDERLALARELHDTVAHHVSAIAVQAQAGGVVARTQPEHAVRALATIESEATATLAEMRTMVRVLREDGPDTETHRPDDYSPRSGIADLAALARTGTAPAVEVTVGDDLDDLPGPVDTAVYRIAQEALTNALRHARGATRVVITVRRDGSRVRLRVADDGLPAGGRSHTQGFGLTGMAERVQLLGGTFTAGPGNQDGWIVDAALPAEGSP